MAQSTSVTDLPKYRAERWLDQVRDYMAHRDLIYSIDVNRYDDASDDIAMNMLRALSAGGLTLDVYVQIRVWNGDIEEILDGQDFGTGEVRFYEKFEDGNYYTLAEFERQFHY